MKAFPSLRLSLTALSLVLAGAAHAASPDSVLKVFGGALLFGGASSTQRLEQIYYLGTYDPDDRIPPTFFRIRVRGQASFISRMKFGSGWVPSSIADSLGENLEYGATPPSSSSASPLDRPFGASFVQYGPEGFRTVPNTHRLAIVMGSDPQAFFKMVDTVTATLSGGPFAPVQIRQRAIKERLEQVDKEQASIKSLREELQLPEAPAGR